jgi:hypothetical protein
MLMPPCQTLDALRIQVAGLLSASTANGREETTPPRYIPEDIAQVA